MDRRGFLKDILAAGVAPFVVTASGVLMPVKKLVTPTQDLTCDLLVVDGLLAINDSYNSVIYQINDSYNFIYHGPLQKVFYEKPFKVFYEKPFIGRKNG